ncbi:MAG: ATPase, T2SS/T4P/T4SS family [Candidatus Eisenbacteria bacterium]
MFSRDCRYLTYPAYPRFRDSPSTWRFSLLRRPQRVARNITSILLEAGVVTQEQIELGLVRQRETGLRIGETLVQSGAVTEEDVGWALSRQLGLTLVDIEPGMLDLELVRAFRESVLRRSDALPLLREGTVVSFAVADPTDHEVIDHLEEACGGPVDLCVGTPTAIRRALDAVFRSGPNAAHAIPGAVIPGAPSSDPSEGAIKVVWERSGATFLAFHVASAHKLGMHEVHFEPRDGQLHVSYRANERLEPVATEPLSVLEALLSRLDSLGGPALVDSVHARGAISCPLPAGDLPVDVSLLATAFGPSVTLCLRPVATTVPTLEDLGIAPVDAASLRGALASRAGLVLVCGPPGAGGSTTLASLLEAVPSGGLRAIAFEPYPVAPLGHAVRVHGGVESARALWQDVTTGQRADVVVLDDVLTGGHVAQALAAAGSRRLLLVRTDWCDTFALLDHLAASREGRSVLAGRLIAVLQQRQVIGDSHLFEVLLPSDALRAALAAGADRAHLADLVAQSGFQTLADQARRRVANGTLGELEAARALTQEPRIGL